LRRYTKCTLKLCVGLLFILAGCDHRTHKEADGPANATGGGSQSTGATQATNSSTTHSHVSLLGTSDSAIVPSPSSGAQPDARDAALMGATAMAVSAAKGASYRSADGELIVEIPPGVLTKDATVRFARLDTSQLPDGPVGTPGIVIVADWGGATIRSDGSVSVKARVDDRFMHSLAVAAPKADPAILGLSRSGDRWYLPVVIRPDVAGRPESVIQTPIGTGALVEVARLPAEARRVPEAIVVAGEPDMLPLPTGNQPTLAPKSSDDALVERYPPLPEALSKGSAYHPIEFIETDDGSASIAVRGTISETVSGTRALLSCMLNPCIADPATKLVDADRFNKALFANRQPPAALLRRVRQPIESRCPPGYARAVAGQIRR
jgi:hypothetical protein